MTAQHDVIIVGAGVVGAAIALELAESGARVRVVDAGTGWGAGCSAGNAGLITPSRSLSLASRANIAAGLRSLVSSDESFRMSPHRSLFSWLPKYLAASLGPGTIARREQLLRMGLKSADLYAGLADHKRASWVTAGVLHVYTRPDSWAEGLRIASQDEKAGLQVLVMDGEQALDFEATLDRGTVGALYYVDDAYCDPLAMTRALGQAAVAAGVEFLPGTEVLGWRQTSSGIESAVTSEGEMTAQAFVLAAGSSSAVLARLAGTALPIEPGKGYSLDVAASYVSPTRAVLFPEGHCVVTPLGDRTRMTSKLELTGDDLSISNKTIAGILRIASAGFQTHGHPELLKVWRGMRPCSPDGLPFIGRLGTAKNLLAATGHGMLGVTMAPLTAKWVGDLLLGRELDKDLVCADPNRYQRSGRMPAPPRPVQVRILR